MSIRDVASLKVSVEILDTKTDELITYYETDLANDRQRRVFAQQMTSAYLAGQYSIVEPIGPPTYKDGHASK